MRWLVIIGLAAVFAVAPSHAHAPSSTTSLSFADSFRGLDGSSGTTGRAISSDTRRGFGYQLARKLTLGMLAGLNSEVLFGNAPPGEGALAALMLYVPSMFVVDELIQYWDLDGLSTVALGALYGIWLEGLVTNTIPESPLWFLTAITTFWHGVMTTWAASELTETWLPRRQAGTLQPGWMIAGTVALASWPFLFEPKGAPFQAADWPSYAASAATAAGLGALVFSRVVAGRPYRPRPLLAAGTVAAGFGLGFGVLALTAAETGEAPYTTQDHLIRGGIYLTIEAATLAKVFARRRGEAGAWGG